MIHGYERCVTVSVPSLPQSPISSFLSPSISQQMIVQAYRQFTPNYAVKPANLSSSSRSFVLEINPYSTVSRTAYRDSVTDSAVNVRDPRVNNGLTAYTPSCYPDYTPTVPETTAVECYGPPVPKPENRAPDFPSRQCNHGLDLIAKRRIPGTDIDSASREPIPRCHPRTRQNLRNHMITCATSDPSTNDPRIFWLSGPAGIGKSAVAQSVAEELQALGFLGAAFFFSKDRGLYGYDPTRIVTSIAYQLAISVPEYGRIVVGALAKDPMILQKSLVVQFKELLVEPFVTIMIEGVSVSRKLVTVVVDGLDEYPNQKVQRELVKLIGRYAYSSGFPLMWVITSRLEWYLESAFFHSEPCVSCIHEDLHHFGRGDVEVYLKDGLRGVAQSHPGLVDETMGWDIWPSAEDVHQLVKLAGNSFTVAVSILEIIKDTTSYDPSARLQDVLDYINNPTPLALTKSSTISHPFAAINKLYSNILSRLPRSLLHVILQIFCLWCTQSTLTAFELSNLLALERETFCYTLRHLHGLVRFSHDDKHNRQFLRYIHPSFLSFITDPTIAENLDIGGSQTSGSISTSVSGVSSAIAKSLFLLQKPRLHTALKGLSWRSQPPQGFDPRSLAVQDLTVSHRIVTLATQLAWGFCIKIELGNDRMTTGQSELFWYDFFVKFDFGKLCKDVGGCGRIPVNEFRGFVRWLYRLVRRRHRGHELVRTTPYCPCDRALIEKCEGIAEPMDLDASSCGPENEGEGDKERVHYVLLGLNAKTALVLLTPESVTIYSIHDLDKL